jgi:hypothetical protein
VKLAKGPLKVITFTSDAVLRENELRARAGGKKFHPTVWVSIEPKEGGKVRLVGGFAVKLPADAEVKSGITQFPHQWTGFRNVPRYWIETTESVEVITDYEETK